MCVCRCVYTVMCILFVFGVVLVLSKILLSCCPVAVYGYSEKLPSSFKLFAVVCYALILSYKVENVPLFSPLNALDIESLNQ